MIAALRRHLADPALPARTLRALAADAPAAAPLSLTPRSRPDNSRLAGPCRRPAPSGTRRARRRPLPAWHRPRLAGQQRRPNASPRSTTPSPAWPATGVTMAGAGLLRLRLRRIPATRRCPTPCSRSLPFCSKAAPDVAGRFSARQPDASRAPPNCAPTAVPTGGTAAAPPAAGRRPDAGRARLGRPGQRRPARYRRRPGRQDRARPQRRLEGERPPAAGRLLEALEHATAG
jgi:hypothetical protein